MTRFFLFTILSFVCLGTMNAQISEFQVGLALPQGDFKDDDEDDAIYDGAGVAAPGLYLGYKYMKPINSNGLYWMADIGLMFNPMQKFFREDLKDVSEGDLKIPKYFNVPVTGGIHYERPVSNLRLFGEAGLGVNMLYITKLETGNRDLTYTIKHKPSLKLAFRIGAGVVLKEKYTIGLNYFALGAHRARIEGIVEFDGERETERDRFNRSLSVSTLNILSGFRF